jgi:hypothetical protein
MLGCNLQKTTKYLDIVVQHKKQDKTASKTGEI